MRVLVPAWPPIDSRSITSASSPPTTRTRRLRARPVRRRRSRRRTVRDGRSPCACACRVARASPGAGRRAACRPGGPRRHPGAFLVAGRRKSIPSAESGRWNACGTPLRARCVRGVAARRTRIGDDGELAPARRVLATPLLQELGDETVKDLVRRTPRLHGVVVDVAERHRILDRGGRVLVRPAAPRDEERALRVRMRSSCTRSRNSPVSALVPRAARTIATASPLSKSFELGECRLGRRAADDRVVAAYR